MVEEVEVVGKTEDDRIVARLGRADVANVLVDDDVFCTTNASTAPLASRVGLAEVELADVVEDGLTVVELELGNTGVLDVVEVVALDDRFVEDVDVTVAGLEVDADDGV